MPSTTTTLQLAKQNFKFSAAHFLIFNDHDAEKLHGHNYQVQVDIEVPDSSAAHLKPAAMGAPSPAAPEASGGQEKGYFIDFNVFKKFIKARLDQWDEVILLPALHKDMKVTANGASLDVRFRERHYVFPQNEVVLLQVTNTSVEQFSKLLAQDFHAEFQKYGVRKIRVYVEESAGQGAWTEIK